MYLNETDIGKFCSSKLKNIKLDRTMLTPEMKLNIQNNSQNESLVST
jgi:hypothetical protein